MAARPEQTAVLYWFSGTGNSLAAARSLAAALDAPSLVALTQALREPPPPARTVGIVFPVYAFGLPDIVARFLEAVPLTSDPYVFTVATAAAIPGATHGQAAEILGRRGVALAAGWTLRMPENFSLVNAHLTWPGVNAQARRADRRAAEIAHAVQAGLRGVRQDSCLPLAWAGRQLHRNLRRFLATADRRFQVARHCAGCGVCASVCPVGNIRIDNGMPVWGGHCEGCFACLQWCPVGAIRVGGVAANRRRYHHPGVSAHDIAAQSPDSDA